MVIAASLRGRLSVLRRRRLQATELLSGHADKVRHRHNNEHSVLETPHLLVKLLRRSLLGRVARLRVLLLGVLLRIALLCARGNTSIPQRTGDNNPSCNGRWDQRMPTHMRLRHGPQRNDGASHSTIRVGTLGQSTASIPASPHIPGPPSVT